MTTTQPRPRRIVPPEERIRPIREDVRSAIRAAATAHFLKVGYRAAKLDDIAQLAGFTKGAVYSNFTSKQGLFLDLLADRIAIFGDALSKRIRIAKTTDTILEAVCAALAKEVIRETAWHLLVVEFSTLAVGNPELSEKYDELRASRRNGIALRIRSAGVEIPTKTARSATAALLAAVHGFSLELASDPNSISEPEIERALRAMLDAFVPKSI